MAGGLPTAARGGRSMGGHIKGHRLPTAACDGELPTVVRREASGRSLCCLDDECVLEMRDVVDATRDDGERL
uniref:Uncharacterized protein n=1 Tax=Oryza glumipatula TaxID=40148 RepID=A0A0E0AWB3_9ORYZ